MNRLTPEREREIRRLIGYAPTSVRELIAEIDVLREAMQLIAIGPRADGTFNRSREACMELARDALGLYVNSVLPTQEDK